MEERDLVWEEETHITQFLLIVERIVGEVMELKFTNRDNYINFINAVSQEYEIEVPNESDIE